MERTGTRLRPKSRRWLGRSVPWTQAPAVLHGAHRLRPGRVRAVRPALASGVDDLALGDVHIDRRDVEDLPPRALTPAVSARSDQQLRHQDGWRRSLRPSQVPSAESALGEGLPAGFPFSTSPAADPVGREARSVRGWPRVAGAGLRPAFRGPRPGLNGVHCLDPTIRAVYISRIEFIWLGNTQTVAIRSRYTRLVHY